VLEASPRDEILQSPFLHQDKMICEETEELEKTIELENDQNFMRGRSVSVPMYQIFFKDSAVNSPCLSTPRELSKKLFIRTL